MWDANRLLYVMAGRCEGSLLGTFIVGELRDVLINWERREKECWKSEKRGKRAMQLSQEGEGNNVLQGVEEDF